MAININIAALLCLPGILRKVSMSALSCSASVSGSVLREVRVKGCGLRTQRIWYCTATHLQYTIRGIGLPKGLTAFQGSSLCWFFSRLFSLPLFLYSFCWHLCSRWICNSISLPLSCVPPWLYFRSLSHLVNKQNTISGIVWLLHCNFEYSPSFVLCAVALFIGNLFVNTVLYRV